MSNTKIFLASSEELESDRKEFEIFIRRKNDEWRTKGAYLELIIWEDFLDVMSRTRLQDEYNKAIKGCDIFVMLFFTKVGRYTREEFIAAFGQFEATSKPYIYAYFKDADIKTGSLNHKDTPSLLAFQKKLQQLGHFYTTYVNIQDLQLKFNRQLEKLAAGELIIFHDAQKLVPKLPKELTLSLPKTDPDKIVGRVDDLEELHRLLGKDKRVVLVNGLGGIGKTTLAQVYVSKYYDEYEHIAWISRSTENIANDFLNETGLITYLNIRTVHLEPEKIFEEIVLKLKAIEEKPNLLIIDNGEQSLRNYLNMLPGQPAWHLLVTSREKIEGLHSKELGFLSEEEAVELFKRYYTRKKFSEQDIKDLITTVDYHTLTIEILAKTVQVQRYDAAMLKQAIEKDIKSNTRVSRDKNNIIEKVGSYLSTVFSLSKLREDELWLLEQFACLPSEFHPYDLLSELLLDEDSVYKDNFAETVANLSRKGWLFYDEDNDSYKMHRIIAEVVKRDQPIGTADVKPLISALTQKLRIDQDKDNPIDKFIWVPFGKTLLANVDEDSAEITRLQNNLALVLRDLGDYQGAKTLLEKAVLSDEKNYGTEHPSTSISYSNLAMMLQDLGDYQGAKTLMEKAMLSDEKNYGIEHPSTATSYSNLALVLQSLGDYPRAKTLLEKAVLSDEKNYGTEHPSTSISYSNLGMVLRDLGDYQGAKTLMEKAMLSDEKNFGTEHPSTAISYGNLAKVLQDLGKTNEALALSEKALNSFKNILPEGHPYIATASEIYQSIKNDTEKD